MPGGGGGLRRERRHGLVPLAGRPHPPAVPVPRRGRPRRLLHEARRVRIA